MSVATANAFAARAMYILSVETLSEKIYSTPMLWAQENGWISTELMKLIKKKYLLVCGSSAPE
jgi:hypothetical protein